jgi:hypothetical protein
VRPWQKSTEDEVTIERPVLDHRQVRSSNGQVQDRPVVELPIVLVDREVNVEVTLSSRSKMSFRMLIGREALRRGFDVTSTQSYLGGRAPRPARRRNRGRAE